MLKNFLKDVVKSKDEDGKVIVELSKDELEAVLVIKKPKGHGAEPKIEDAFQEIQRQGISYGLDKNLLNNIFAKKAYNKKFVIAKGVPVVPSRPGKIRYFFHTKPNIEPLEGKKGKLDYKNIKLIQNVKKGDKICEFTPAVIGKNGKTVTGKDLPVQKVKDIKKPFGIYVVDDPDNENTLIAEIDGAVTKRGDMIEVSPTLVVTTDVNFKTGNIESDVPTQILGDVKAGFSVKVDGDLEINGVIEDAEVHAMGNILAKKGVYGKKQAKISANDSISIRSSQHADIIGKGDVQIHERLADSTVIADGVVKITSKQSDIHRSRILAKEGAVLANIGNDNYEPVDIVLGVDGEIFLEKESVRKQIKQIKKSIAETDKSIRLAQKMQAFKGKVSEQKAQVTELQRDYADLMRKLDELKEQESALETQLNSSRNESASLTVTNKIYPKVTITICDKKILTTEEKTNIEYKLADGELTEVGISE